MLPPETHGQETHAHRARTARAWLVPPGSASSRLALAGAASATGVGHEAHAADQDCAVCRLRDQPAAERSGSLQVAEMHNRGFEIELLGVASPAPVVPRERGEAGGACRVPSRADAKKPRFPWGNRGPGRSASATLGYPARGPGAACALEVPTRTPPPQNRCHSRPRDHLLLGRAIWVSGPNPAGRRSAPHRPETAAPQRGSTLIPSSDNPRSLSMGPMARFSINGGLPSCRMPVPTPTSESAGRNRRPVRPPARLAPPVEPPAGAAPGESSPPAGRGRVSPPSVEHGAPPRPANRRRRPADAA